MRREHGGGIRKGRRKLDRPIDLKKSLHVTLRSQHAQGVRALTRHQKLIEKLLARWSWYFGVKVRNKAICGNHIHLLIQGKDRVEMQNFFRVVAGHIAQRILEDFPLPNKPKGPSWKKRKFWEDLIYSKIVTWGREYNNVFAYVTQNALEAIGAIPYQERRRKKAPT